MNLTKEEYKTIVDQSQILIWRSNTETLCDYFNSAWLKFTGRTIEQELGNGWAEGVHPDDFDRCLKIYLSHFEKRKIFEMEYRLRRYDGKYRWIFDRGVPFYDNDGEFKGYIGSCFDIHQSHNHQSEIKNRLEEKSILLKEVHHRVKNNLQLISSLMSLQALDVHDQLIKQMYHQTKLRINAIALVHEKLYHSENLAEVDYDEYLKSLAENLLYSTVSLPRIKLNYSCDAIKLNSDIAISLGILINEILTNAVKYGTIENDNPIIDISLKESMPYSYLLEIGDNGHGFEMNESFKTKKTLGLSLINELTKQLHGNLKIDNTENGVKFSLQFEN